VIDTNSDDSFRLPTKVSPMRPILITLLFSTLLLPMIGGCTQAAERVDCNAVCSRYQECFDSDYDVDDCVARCSDSDDTNAADECEACIDDASCAESFACTPECAGIVP
jgi:hypothetical protein